MYAEYNERETFKLDYHTIKNIVDLVFKFVFVLFMLYIFDIFCHGMFGTSLMDHNFVHRQEL